MVVGLISRIRNITSRPYHLVLAGDPFYVPKVGGEPCLDDVVEIPPGFDQPVEGIVVPWAATSTCGLVVGEGPGHVAEPSEQIRCVVGPSELDDGAVDWLRLHEEAWQPIAQERWMALGRRHLFGAIGSEVELTLTFRDRYSFPGEHLDQPPWWRVAFNTNFEREAVSAPPNTVFLNVYDLAPAASIPNSMLCNTLVKTFGAFHAAVEVYGEEWGFYRQLHPDDCGICRSRHPRRHSVHVYRQSVNLGVTALRDWEVWTLIRQDLIPEWPSRRYDLIHSNCIHFCDELQKLLGVKPVPSWVRGLHETGAALFRVAWPLSWLVGGGDAGPAALPAPSPPDVAEDDVGREEQAEARGGVCDFNLKGGKRHSKRKSRGGQAPQEGIPGAGEQQERTPATGSTALPENSAPELPDSARLRPQFLPEPLPQGEALAAAAAQGELAAPPAVVRWQGAEAISSRSRSWGESDGEGSGISFASLDPEERNPELPCSATGSEGVARQAAG